MQTSTQLQSEETRIGAVRGAATATARRERRMSQESMTAANEGAVLVRSECDQQQQCAVKCRSVTFENSIQVKRLASHASTHNEERSGVEQRCSLSSSDALRTDPQLPECDSVGVRQRVSQSEFERQSQIAQINRRSKYPP